MKKIFTLTIFTTLCLFLFNVEAQESKKGLKIGLNSATLYGDDISGNDPILSFNVGAFFRFRPEGNLSGHLEFLYSRQGTEVDGNQVYLNYLSLPILGRLNFFDGAFGITAGPQISYLASTTGDLEPDGYELRDLYSSIDFSASIGAELDVISGLLIGARYNFSFVNMGSGDELEDTSGPISTTFTAPEKLRNGVIQLYAGFTF